MRQRGAQAAQRVGTRRTERRREARALEAQALIVGGATHGDLRRPTGRVYARSMVMRAIAVVVILATSVGCSSKDEGTAKRLSDLEERLKQLEVSIQGDVAASKTRSNSIEQQVQQLDKAVQALGSAAPPPSWWCGPGWCGRGKALCERTSKQPCELRRGVYCAIVMFSTMRTSVGMYYGETACAPTMETCVSGLAKLEERAPVAIDSDRCIAVQ